MVIFSLLCVMARACASMFITGYKKDYLRMQIGNMNLIRKGNISNTDYGDSVFLYVLLYVCI